MDVVHIWAADRGFKPRQRQCFSVTSTIHLGNSDLKSWMTNIFILKNSYGWPKKEKKLCLVVKSGVILKKNARFSPFFFFPKFG